MEADLVAIDRKIEWAAREIDLSRTPMISGEIDRDPLAGHDDLTDPTRTKHIDNLHRSLPAWLRHLHLYRATFLVSKARWAAVNEERGVDAFGGKSASLRAMIRALARPRQTVLIAEDKAVAAIEELAPSLFEHVFDEWQERRQIARTFEHTACCVGIAPEIASKAADALHATEDELREELPSLLGVCRRPQKGARWADFLYAMRDPLLADGWPATLTGRWFSELFRGTELLSGVNVDIQIEASRSSPWADFAGLHLTPATGAWTYSRALHALGAALRLFVRAPTTLFCAHSSPHDVRPHTLGEAFAALSLEPVFHARARRQTAQKSQQSALRMRIARLLCRRHHALRIVVGASLPKGEDAFFDTFEQFASRALGVEIARGMAPVFCAPSWGGYAEDVARFSAIETGDALAREMVERFDIDWWRNPKSADFVLHWCQKE